MAELEKLAAARQQEPRGVVHARAGSPYESGEWAEAEKSYARAVGPQGRRPQLVQPGRHPRAAPGPSRRAHRVRARRRSTPTVKTQAHRRGRSCPRSHEPGERRRPAAPDPRAVLRSHGTGTLILERPLPRGRSLSTVGGCFHCIPICAHLAFGSSRLAKQCTAPASLGVDACSPARRPAVQNREERHASTPSLRSRSPRRRREQRLRSSLGRALGLGLILTSGTAFAQDKPQEEVPLLGPGRERPAARVPHPGAEPLQDARPGQGHARSRSRSSRAS